MKIKDFDIFIKDADLDLKDEILNTEFSKSGLSEFHKNNPDGKFLMVTLMDKYSATVFDKSGTFPAESSGNGTTYDPTGAFVGNIHGRRVSSDKTVRIIADVDNVFDYINYFENELDVAELNKGE